MGPPIAMQRQQLAALIDHMTERQRRIEARVTALREFVNWLSGQKGDNARLLAGVYGAEADHLAHDAMSLGKDLALHRQLLRQLDSPITVPVFHSPIPRGDS